MSAYWKNLLVLGVACSSLLACGKSSAPAMSAQDAYKQCTSNQVLGTQLGAGGGDGKDMAESMAKIINDCMEKHHFKCDQPSPGAQCNWSAVK